jgi:hypothetical protein
MLAHWPAPIGGRRLGDMMLLRSNTASADQDAWTASSDIRTDLDQVLHAVTRPDSIASWAPVGFDVEGLAGGRLRAGSRERVSGSIAGIGATFEVEVTRADRERLQLVAHGPVSLDVDYGFSEHDDGVTVDAKVAILPQRGLKAQVLQAATAALLNAGALGTALRRLEKSISRPVEADRCYPVRAELLAA